MRTRSSGDMCESAGGVAGDADGPLTGAVKGEGWGWITTLSTLQTVL